MREDEIGWACVTHGKREECIQALEGKLKERNFSEDLGVDGMISLKWILKTRKWRVWTEFVSVRIGTSVTVL
jgi:hypothetical protein